VRGQDAAELLALELLSHRPSPSQADDPSLEFRSDFFMFSFSTASVFLKAAP
jgi:hypothetical protein